MSPEEHLLPKVEINVGLIGIKTCVEDVFRDDGKTKNAGQEIEAILVDDWSEDMDRSKTSFEEID